MTPYQIDTRLKKDSYSIGQLQLCEVRLINDARWCWLLLIPMRDGLVEVFDLGEKEQELLASETVFASIVLKKICNAEKINTGALGNIVRQLHVHVIARQRNDANWPGPIWGFGTAEPYVEQDAKTLIRQLQSELDVEVF